MPPTVSHEKLITVAKLSGGAAFLMLVAVFVSTLQPGQGLLAAVYTFASNGATISITASPTQMYAGTNGATVSWSASAGVAVGSCSITDSPDFNTPVLDPTNMFNTGADLPTGIAEGSLFQNDTYLYIVGGYSQSSNLRHIYRAPLSNPTAWVDTGASIPLDNFYISTLVLNNRVYMLGGQGTTRVYSASLSDPTSGWTQEGTLSVPSATSVYSTQFQVIGSTIYMFGGYESTSSGGKGFASIYSASTAAPGVWTDTGFDLPDAVYGSESAVIGNYIYLFGGAVSATAVNTIYRAPISNPTSWSKVAGKTLPFAGSGQLVTLGNTLYLYGNNDIYTASVSDPTTWTDTHTIIPRIHSPDQMALVNGIVYVFGGMGQDSDGNPQPDSDIYSDLPPGNPTVWDDTHSSTVPDTRSYAQSAIIGNSIYIFGGLDGTGSNEKSSIYVASTTNPSNIRALSATLPAALGHSQLAILGNSMFLFGGSTGGQPVKNIYAASTTNPTVWKDTGKSLPGVLAGSQLAILGPNMYLFGGTAGSGLATDVIYTASTSNPYKWIKLAQKLPDKMTLSQLAVIGNSIYLFGGGGSQYAPSFDDIYAASTSNPTAWVKYSGKLPTAMDGASLAVSTDHVYLFGGSGLKDILSAPLSNPLKWTDTGANLPDLLGGSSLVMLNGDLYLIGGDNDVVYKSSINTGLPFAAYANSPWKTDGGYNTGTVWPATSDTTYTMMCKDTNGNSGSVAQTIQVFPAPVTSISANMVDGTTTISWSAQYVDSCTVSGPGMTTLYQTSPSPSTVIGSNNYQPVGATAGTYTLSCSAPIATITKTATAVNSYYYAAVKLMPSFSKTAASHQDGAQNPIYRALDGWPAPLYCSYPPVDGSEKTCISKQYYTTFGTFSAFLPSSLSFGAGTPTSNGATQYFTATNNAGRYSIPSWTTTGSHPWTSTVVGGSAITVPAGSKVDLEWTCQPSQRDFFEDNCGLFGLDKCTQSWPVNLFDSASSTNFSTGGQPAGYAVVTAPASGSISYSVQCKNTANNSYGPTMSQKVTIGASAPAAPSATISSSTEMTLGDPVLSISAAFAIGSGDTITGSAIKGSDGTTILAGGSGSASLQTYTFNPSVAGTYTFYAALQTSTYNTWTNYASMQVIVNPAPPTCTLTGVSGTKLGGTVFPISWSMTGSPTSISSIVATTTTPTIYPYTGDEAVSSTSILTASGSANVIASSTVTANSTFYYEMTVGNDGGFVTCDSGTMIVTPNSSPGPTLPTITSFKATRIRSGGQSTLSWNISSIPSGITCNISPANKLASVPVFSGTTGTVLTTALTGPTTYTLGCGTGLATTTAQATTAIVPSYQEI